MSIIDHAEWPVLKWCLYLEYVGRDPRAADDVPRYRIEVKRQIPLDLERHLLTLTSPCVACGLVMSPIRAREHGGLYFAATCEEGLKGACSKGSAAREEYRRIREALLGDDFGSPPPGVMTDGWLPL